jgi:hypothetical protein
MNLIQKWVSKTGQKIYEQLKGFPLLFKMLLDNTLAIIILLLGFFLAVISLIIRIGILVVLVIPYLIQMML